MTDSEITTTILRQIRDEIAKTNARHDIAEERLDGMNERMERGFERLDLRASNLERIVIDVHGQVQLLTRFVMNKHDKVIDDLRKRIAKLEKKVG